MRKGRIYELRYEGRFRDCMVLLNLSAVCVRAFTPKRTLFRGALKSVSVGRVRVVECYSDAFGKKIKENCIFVWPIRVLFAFFNRGAFRLSGSFVV